MTFAQKITGSALAVFAAAFVAGVSAPQEPAAVPSRLAAPSMEAVKKTDSGDAHYLAISGSRLNEILDDPDHLVSESFQVPAGIRPIVGFWLKIYAKYSLYQTLVYDRDHHDVVYEVVDTRELFQKGLSPVALEITTRNRIRRTIGGYRAALHALAKNPNARFPTGTPGANLLRLWGRKRPGEWRTIEGAIRTQAGQRDRIMEGLANADRFFPAMEAIFRKFGIPHEITRLPLVESSFNLMAISKADAVGVWQFLEKSAAEYLVVDPVHKIDERLSPIKSTYAAARMFKRNYAILGDWGLAIIAYNHGAKNLIPIRNRYKGQKITQLLRATKKTPLGYASRSFLAEFLAILHAERYRNELYGAPSKPHSDAISIVRMKKPASIFDIAALYNISIYELRVFNPDIFDVRRKLPAGTRVVLPRKHGESLVEAPRLNDGTGTPGSSSSPARGIASEVEFVEYVR